MYGVMSHIQKVERERERERERESDVLGRLYLSDVTCMESCHMYEVYTEREREKETAMN